MTNTSNSKTEFQWDEKLIREIVGLAHKDGYHSIQETNLDDFINKFKEKKIKEAEEPKRIEVLVFEPQYGNFENEYIVKLNSGIPEEKYEAVKKAIEEVLNEANSKTTNLQLSPIPKEKWVQGRIDDINDSIKRYINLGEMPPTALYSERAELLKSICHKVENKPSDTIQDKDWEIISFGRINEDDATWVLSNDGLFDNVKSKGHGWSVDDLLNQEGCTYSVKSGCTRIFSVRRLSDGEVFTVGDVVYFFGSKESSPIEKFAIDTFNKNHIAAYNGAYGAGIGVLRKVEKKLEKPPLGLMPKNIWIEKRIEDIAQAIRRYIESNFHVPQEWIDEKEKLRKQLNNQ